MRKLLYYVLIFIGFVSCDSKFNYDETIPLYNLTIELADSVNKDKRFDGAILELRCIGRDAVFTDTVNATSKVDFIIPAGIYEATSQHILRDGINNVEISNGSSGQIVVGRESSMNIRINMTSTKTSQLVIKELYNGGIMKDDGQTFQSDKCFILYNNSSTIATYDNLCIAIVSPYNSHAGNKWYNHG